MGPARARAVGASEGTRGDGPFPAGGAYAGGPSSGPRADDEEKMQKQKKRKEEDEEAAVVSEEAAVVPEAALGLPKRRQSKPSHRRPGGQGRLLESCERLFRYRRRQVRLGWSVPL